MNKTDEITQALNTIQEKLKDPVLQDKFQDYSRVIQFIFPDLKTSRAVTIEQGTITQITKKDTGTPDIQVTADSEILLDVFNKKINPLLAYSTGKVKIKGKLTDLLKLQKLL